MTEPSNRLGNEKSPYLLQHKDNPVWWYPWSDEAFERARTERKPIFLSIGYATCHWCHVMARESFEDEEVAALLNQHFVSIKVDREEHPDVDQVYMTALQALGRSGGWPMTVVMTPDLRPFFAGTYFPRPVLLSILDQIASTWTRNPRPAIELGDALHDRLERLASPFPGGGTIHPDLFQNFLEQAWTRFDRRHGGFGGAPKFPPTAALRLLLRIHRKTGDSRALDMVNTTLEKMARGGIYDHLGGGFARYATDERWLVPHFEKMLYDNATLTWTYLEAYQVTGRPMYAEVARETLDYVLEVMTRPGGGFYSAEDADSEGEEGKFYVWHRPELERLLDRDVFLMTCEVYGVTSRGNFHGANILHLTERHDWEIKRHPLVQEAHRTLGAARACRVRPLKDDKVLTAWNGLMISAMARGYNVLGDPRYLEAARDAARFIERTLYADGLLLRRYRDGDARHEGTLEDYAYLIQGLLDLHESDFDPHWARWAMTLQHTQDGLFRDEDRGGYYQSSDRARSLIVRTKDYTDGATPNPNGCSALNLLRLARLFRDDRLEQDATQVLAGPGRLLQDQPSFFAHLLLAADFHLEPVREVVLVLPPSLEGDALPGDVQDFLTELRKPFTPGLVVSLGTLHADTDPERSPLPILADKVVENQQPTLYVCDGTTCHAPTHPLHLPPESGGS